MGFVHAFRGVKHVFKDERNARFHFLFACFTFAAGFFFNLSTTEWLMVVMCTFAMFSAEAFNSAIEELADRVNPNFDPQIGKVKDLAAAAVLLLTFGVVIIGLIIFLPRILNLF